MDKGTLRKINRSFGDKFKVIREFNSFANQNYLLEGTSKDLVVARTLGEQKPEKVPLEYRVQKHLIKKGVLTPKLKPLPNGDLTLRIGKKCLTFTKYIEADKSKPNPKYIGEALALYHKALSDFPAKELRPNWLSPKYQEKLKFQRRYQATSEVILKRINLLFETLERAGLPKAAIHGDLNIGNMIRKSHRIIGVFDLETTEHNFRVLDVGMSIFQTSPQYSFDYDHLSREIVAGYTSITKLTKDEISQIKNATLYSAACTSLWSLSFEGGNKDFLKGYQQLQQKIEENFNV